MQDGPISDSDGAAAVCADMFGEQTCIKQGNNNDNNYSICVALFIVLKALKQTCIQKGKGVSGLKRNSINPGQGGVESCSIYS